MLDHIFVIKHKDKSDYTSPPQNYQSLFSLLVNFFHILLIFCEKEDDRRHIPRFYAPSAGVSNENTAAPFSGAAVFSLRKRPPVAIRSRLLCRFLSLSYWVPFCFEGRWGNSYNTA
jgi:hypothetical protein